MKPPRRGQKFYWHSKPWVCLDGRKRKVLAYSMNSREPLTLPMKEIKGKRRTYYRRFLKAIDLKMASIRPGSVINTEDGQIEITKSSRSGYAEGVNERGDHCCLDRWDLLVVCARAISHQSPASSTVSAMVPQGSSESLPSSVPATPEPVLPQSQPWLIVRVPLRLIRRLWPRGVFRAPEMRPAEVPRN